MQFSHLHFKHPNIWRTWDELSCSNFFLGSITPKTLKMKKLDILAMSSNQRAWCYPHSWRTPSSLITTIMQKPSISKERGDTKLAGYYCYDKLSGKDGPRTVILSSKYRDRFKLQLRELQFYSPMPLLQSLYGLRHAKRREGPFSKVQSMGLVRCGFCWRLHLPGTYQYESFVK